MNEELKKMMFEKAIDREKRTINSWNQTRFIMFFGIVAWTKMLIAATKEENKKGNN